ncbi:snare associated Golgi protein-domain-containing protein [Crucibulum laeve]|uniref:Snare associated Golgi protein-domain-containing protein n=1 Tax=Crucibulum laeve TaxID=68775 RepID=A0A5C3ME21_9AGAR|nr:snare associated Golgi protein-domain-containing protein [Crucibulum laeve]
MSASNQSLSPNPPSRHRASSTSCRPAFSLGRRRSNTCLQPAPLLSPPISPPPTPEPISTAHPPSSMLVVFASRFLDWLHLPSKHSQSWSTPSSPRSSTEEFVLPLSASAQKAALVDEKTASAQHSFDWWHGFPSVHAPILVVILLFPISTAIVLFCLSTLPISLAWPHTLADVAQLGRDLHGYSQSGTVPTMHVIGVMAISAIWKHAWSIPGSVIWNVLAGALFPTAFATILLTALTMIGSACATLLSTPLAPFLSYLLPRAALDMTRNALGGDSDSDQDAPGVQSKPKSSAWVRLSVLRLIGVVPWSGINIACGVCGVPLLDCMLGTFIGCLPWTAVTCQIGDILQTVASTPSPTPQTISSLLTSPAIIVKLVLLSFLSLAPILGRDRLRAMISPSQPASPHAIDERHPRWVWVQDWRTKIRLASRSRTRGQDQNELQILVQEKRALEDLPS